MLNFAPEKMMMIFFVALLVLGPERLPEMARKMGKLAAELRKLSGGFQDEMRRAVVDATADTTTTTSSSTSSTSSEITEGDASTQVVSAGDASTTQTSSEGDGS